MLEIARVLKQGPYPPEKTIVFIAWSGGEHFEGFSVANAVNDTTAFDAKNVEAVLELSGVGAGDGDALLLGEGSSYRLMKLFQQAAGQMGGKITNRGRAVHAGMKISSGFGERKGVSAFLSWEGSDRLSHTDQDTLENIDREKINQTGKIISLVLSVIGREVDY
jgi:Zn-dependent M28 family amino/carboxypeptidase